jgi:hypothetical protein
MWYCLPHQCSEHGSVVTYLKQFTSGMTERTRKWECPGYPQRCRVYGKIKLATAPYNWFLSGLAFVSSYMTLTESTYILVIAKLIITKLKSLNPFTISKFHIFIVGMLAWIVRV